MLTGIVPPVDVAAVTVTLVIFESPDSDFIANVDVRAFSIPFVNGLTL